MPQLNTTAEAVFPAILTKKEAAAYCRLSPRYLENAAKDGRLRIFKLGRNIWRVRRGDLDAFLESGATIGGAE